MTEKRNQLSADEARAAALAEIDESRLFQLVHDAVSIPSITPNESEIAKFFEEKLHDAGVDCQLQPVPGDRFNVVGSVGGNSGRSLLLAGHLDTVHADDWIAHWEGTDRADPFRPTVVDGAIWGRGVADQKAGLCCITEALWAIRSAGFRPAGTVWPLFVCDEESGQPGSGTSDGMREALRVWEGATPDFAIYTEPTTLAIYTAQMGFLIADFEVIGQSAYFGTPERGVDALKAGHALLSELWAYSDQIGTGDPHELLGDRFVLVTEVASGGNIAVPGEFRASLIAKLLPGDDLDDTATALRDIAARIADRHSVEVIVQFNAGRDHAVGGTPAETDPASDPVRTLAESVNTITGTPARIEGAPYWSEGPFLAARSTPTVYFSPGDIADCHTPFEHVAKDDLILGARVLVDFIARWCGLEAVD